MVVDLPRGQRPVNAGLAAVDLSRERYSGGRLRSQPQGAAFESRKRAHQKVRPQPSKGIMDLAGGRVGPDGQWLGHRDRSRVETFIDLHNGHTGLLIARHDRAIDRSRPAPAWQQRSVDIETT